MGSFSFVVFFLGVFVCFFHHLYLFILWNYFDPLPLVREMKNTNFKKYYFSNLYINLYIFICTYPFSSSPKLYFHQTTTPIRGRLSTLTHSIGPYWNQPPPQTRTSGRGSQDSSTVGQHGIDPSRRTHEVREGREEWINRKVRVSDRLIRLTW